MAKAFTQLKNSKLAPTDKLTFGKYKGCRVCDCWDDWAYFIWLDKQHPGMFSKECTTQFNIAWQRAETERYQLEEVDPYFFDDVPF